MTPIQSATIQLLRLVARAQADEWDVCRMELTEPAMALVRMLNKPDPRDPDDILDLIEKVAWVTAIWGVPPNLPGDGLAVTTAIAELDKALGVIN